MIEILAPAKINLYLHVTGKRDDGYHMLESLVAFVNFGDVLTIKPSHEFSFSYDGEFSKPLDKQRNNLVVHAARSLADFVKRDLNLSIHLTKNIPIGAGLGGGSADAAAVLHGLIQYWDLDISDNDLLPLMLALGADVPVCYTNQSCIMRGIGEDIQLRDIPKNIPILLIYPNKFNATKNIFKNFDHHFQPSQNNIPDLNSDDIFYQFLQNQRNDLIKAAVQVTPEIKDTLNVLHDQNNCLYAQMSGSGSACFGLFKNIEDVTQAKFLIKENHPEWWLQGGFLNFGN